MISGKEALGCIEKEFPEISELIRENEGLLHIQIGEFSHCVQSLIDNGNNSDFARACDLFVVLFTSASPDLKNALNVSFLEHLDFKDNKRKWAYKAMPESMRKAWDEMEAYLIEIHGD